MNSRYETEQIAAEAFFKGMLEGEETIPGSRLNEELAPVNVVETLGSLTWAPHPKKKERPNYSAPVGPIRDPKGQVLEMPLQAWGGKLKTRLDTQAFEIRERLWENPQVVMLVLRGRTYSAQSILGVVWLYFMTKLFGPPKPKKQKKLTP